jgi:hypothetical protein
VGLVPFTWPRPDGRPDSAEPWSSTSRLLNSFEVHYVLAGGWWPNREVTYRSAASWLPQSRIRFDRLVDHLSRTLTGRRSTSILLRACCEAVGAAPGETITTSHAVVKWKMPRLLVTFLDQPAHLTR